MFGKNKKPNLVFLPSYLANNILLSGLIERLGEYFTVYPIELPGFHPEVLPLETISAENMIKFAKEKISELGIEEFWFAGVSFGFFLANNIDDSRCKGYIAFEPYINKHYLSFGEDKVHFYDRAITFIEQHHLDPLIWNTNFLMYSPGSVIPRATAKRIIETNDRKTCLELGRFLLENEKELIFKEKPYALIINENDDTVDGKKIIDLFKKKINQFILIPTYEHHFPKDMSKESFEAILSKQSMDVLLDFVTKIN